MFYGDLAEIHRMTGQGLAIEGPSNDGRTPQETILVYSIAPLRSRQQLTMIWINAKLSHAVLGIVFQIQVFEIHVDVFVFCFSSKKMQNTFWCPILQQTADRLVMNYVVKSMKPLSTVDELSFKALVTGLNPTFLYFVKYFFKY